MPPFLHQPLAAPPLVSGIFWRGARLIAERGWCRGEGLLHVGSPYRPEAASLIGALLWAATGDARAQNVASRQALSVIRTRVDPHRTAPFDDWELLCAWNDTPSRSRAQAIALLMSAHDAAVRDCTGDAQPSHAPDSRTV
ncbi:hypothetical protein C3488_35280 [Streptomyces sp. Ru72]|nr:hypothetical protein C3488_35280 [Streptomyces sp. Ru72]